jgi:hypothetical protein
LKRDNEDGEGEAVLASFAAQLVGAGVPLVLAMQAPVTDRYATALSAEFYRRLATDASLDRCWPWPGPGVPLSGTGTSSPG